MKIKSLLLIVLIMGNYISYAQIKSTYYIQGGLHPMRFTSSNVNLSFIDDSPKKTAFLIPSNQKLSYFGYGLVIGKESPLTENLFFNIDIGAYGNRNAASLNLDLGVGYSIKLEKYYLEPKLDITLLGFSARTFGKINVDTNGLYVNNYKYCNETVYLGVYDFYMATLKPTITFSVPIYKWLYLRVNAGYVIPLFDASLLFFKGSGENPSESKNTLDENISFYNGNKKIHKSPAKYDGLFMTAGIGLKCVNCWLFKSIKFRRK